MHKQLTDQLVNVLVRFVLASIYVALFLIKNLNLLINFYRDTIRYKL